jgi:hypothetical protein
VYSGGGDAAATACFGPIEHVVETMCGLFAEETLLNLHLIVGDDVRAGLFVSACH